MFNVDLISFLEDKLGFKASFSQQGEDIVLDSMISRNKKGFYVDVGAHHPVIYSNTFKFYKRGWRGINIDANPGVMEIFEKVRPRDVNLEIGVTSKRGEMVFFVFEEPAINTFDSLLAEKYISQGHKVVKKIKVKTSPLSDILENNLNCEIIDFMSIDVEGLDLEVLKSNNWDKFSPKIIVVEVPESATRNLENALNSETSNYLISKGYSLVSIIDNSFIFTKN